jgi:hypothetical protein
MEEVLMRPAGVARGRYGTSNFDVDTPLLLAIRARAAEFRHPEHQWVLEQVERFNARPLVLTHGEAEQVGEFMRKHPDQLWGVAPHLTEVIKSEGPFWFEADFGVERFSYDPDSADFDDYMQRLVPWGGTRNQRPPDRVGALVTPAVDERGRGYAVRIVPVYGSFTRRPALASAHVSALALYVGDGVSPDYCRGWSGQLYDLPQAIQDRPWPPRDAGAVLAKAGPVVDILPCASGPLHWSAGVLGIPAEEVRPRALKKYLQEIRIGPDQIMPQMPELVLATLHQLHF